MTGSSSPRTCFLAGLFRVNGAQTQHVVAFRCSGLDIDGIRDPSERTKA